ncbi:hypothetical protein PRIPAC_82641 [Pristionchus pacificus]|uniref:Uncharacterized protein n=1 Tax=Pristionchus pacificus TaxID=54126 RepID=A0A2A6BHJ9_PRIPA|nr:hypothetical protein PRIPAC_82641 [Pristionchus pacificus]|eukprot:PDM65395.1 hypothetical protein PRIPAC_52337 [Pristionchus pacificus]
MFKCIFDVGMQVTSTKNDEVITCSNANCFGYRVVGQVCDRIFCTILHKWHTIFPASSFTCNTKEAPAGGDFGRTFCP